MEKFDLSNGIVASCRYYNGINSFYHVCTLYRDGKKIGGYTAQYGNRTWESYTYQTAIKAAVKKSKHLTDTDKEALLDVLTNEPKKIPLKLI